ncbi:scavenger receptor cysteine-rich domain-containing protein DMBT1-like isoform X2 [Littorina saxatilis]|uniref:scavenger receptor cysteine-rich domain-containing protein DMBT1-like isoform X2 n=1 Tax=Littorina saxatilis TaxID=31220 RepID=UPI0038B529BF
MKTVAAFLLFFVAAPSLVDSAFFKRKGCSSLKQAFEDLQGDVQVLQNAPPLDNVTGPLQTQVTSLQNQTDNQQAALDMLTSQCDCQSYEERLDSLNASLIALQAIVEALVMDPPMSDLNGTLRLVNNFNNETNQGRLEIVINGEWGTICQDFWSKNDAIVACNQLGLPRYY